MNPFGVSLKDVQVPDEFHSIVIIHDCCSNIFLFVALISSVLKAFPSHLMALKLAEGHHLEAIVAFEFQILQEIVEELMHHDLLLHFMTDSALIDMLFLEFGVLGMLTSAEIFKARFTRTSFTARALEDVLLEGHTNRAFVVLDDLFELGLFVVVLWLKSFYLHAKLIIYIKY